jgi:hypothetical protein
MYAFGIKDSVYYAISHYPPFNRERPLLAQSGTPAAAKNGSYQGQSSRSLRPLAEQI